MKLITLKTNEMVDGQRVPVGEVIENFPIPESLEELIVMTEAPAKLTEAEVVACFVYGWKVKNRAKAKNGVDPTKPVSVFKKAGEAKQNEILELARREGLL